MIKAKVKKGSVAVQTKGSLEELVNESVIIMSAIFNSLQKRDPEAADLFKDIIEFAFEQGMIWSFCDGGNGK